MEVTIIFFNVKNMIIEIYLKYVMSLKNLIKLRHLASKIDNYEREFFIKFN